MTCSHTIYSLTNVPVTILLPHPILGKTHLILDILVHLLIFIRIGRIGHGAMFTWHAIKYYIGQSKVLEKFLSKIKIKNI